METKLLGKGKHLSPAGGGVTLSREVAKAPVTIAAASDPSDNCVIRKLGGYKLGCIRPRVVVKILGDTL